MLARNITTNLVGHFLPIVFAIYSIPVLIKSIGLENFGILTIVWMIVGYFSIFDLGLGRALTKRVAEEIKAERNVNIPVVVWTGLVTMAGLGVLAGAVMYLVAPWIAATVIGGAHESAITSTNSFRILAFSIPFVILSTGLRGVLESLGRFDYVNVIRIPMGAWTFVGPLLALIWSSELEVIVFVLVIGRVATTLLYFPLLASSLSGIFSQRTVSKARVLELCRFGGWLTVSNVLSPIMVYMDRFFIGNMLGIGVVAYYTTPYEVVYKLNFIPEAVFGVLFPRMVKSPDRACSDLIENFNIGNFLISFAYIPAVLLLAVFSSQLLAWWISPEFSEKSSLVMKVLCFGLAVNGFSKVSFNVLQAQGRADATALIHLVEVPIYLFFLVQMIKIYGIEGAAYAWAARMVMDLFFLNVLTITLTPLTLKSIGYQGLLFVAICGLFSLALIDVSLAIGIVIYILAMIAFMTFCWCFTIGKQIRQAITHATISLGEKYVRR